MKKLMSLMLAAVLALTLTACGGDTSTDTDSSSADSEGVYTITIGNTGSEQCSDYAGATAFKEYVEANSDGKISVQLMFNGVLGSDREHLESVQMGSCTMLSTGLTQYTNFITDLTALDSPFMFESADDVYALFEDEQFIAALEERFSTANYHYMGMAFQGFRTLTTNREVHTMADMNGMTIRVIESPTPIALWTALGANPTPLAFTEVYTALQQGTIDAQENPLSVITSSRFNEVQDYLSMTEHVYSAAPLMVSKAAYDALPDDLKAIVDEAGVEACQWEREYLAEVEVQWLDELETAGTQINYPDKAPFVDAMSSVYNQFVGDGDDMVSPELLEQVREIISQVE